MAGRAPRGACTGSPTAGAGHAAALMLPMRRTTAQSASPCSAKILLERPDAERSAVPRHPTLGRLAMRGGPSRATSARRRLGGQLRGLDPDRLHVEVLLELLEA